MSTRELTCIGCPLGCSLSVTLENGEVTSVTGNTCRMELVPLADVANYEKKVPVEWIVPEGNNVTQDFIDYALPLIQGVPEIPVENGLPRYARLKKVLAK